MGFLLMPQAWERTSFLEGALIYHQNMNITRSKTPNDAIRMFLFEILENLYFLLGALHLLDSKLSENKAI